MGRPCACGQIPNLTAVIGNLDLFEHGYDLCETGDWEPATPVEPCDLIWNGEHSCAKPHGHTGPHLCPCGAAL